MKTLFLGAISLVVLLAPLSVFAQSREQTPVVIARVNIQDCVYEQKDRDITITCDFVNNGAIQPEIKYAVQLTRKLGDRQVLVDQRIYEENITLAANSKLRKTISYTIPGFAHGEMQVFVAARNTEGLPLALNALGFVTAKLLPGYAEIVADSCYLEIPNEAKPVRYSPLQGVDVSADEPLIAHCFVTNLSDTPLSLTPNLATTWRSLYGKTVEVPEYAYPPLELGAAETKEYVFTLAKPAAPQAYDTTLSFVAGGKQVTNRVGFHYVIQGASATIQNVSLDKAKYGAGETAIVTATWTGSADSFPDSRSGGSVSGAARVHAKIMSKDALCGEARKELESSDEFRQVTLEVPITRTCKNPIVTVEVADSNGLVLASKTSEIPSNLGQPPFYMTEIFYALAGVVGLLLAIAAAVFQYRRIKRKNDMPPPALGVLPLLLLSLLVSAAFFGGSAPLAHADTFGGSGWFSERGADYTFTVNTNKSQYSPSESIGVTMDVSYPSCMNGGGAFSIDATNVPNGQNYHYQSGGSVTCTDQTGLGICEVFLPSYASLSTTFTAPSAVGNYLIHFIGGDAAYPGPNGTSWPYDLPYSVAVPASAPTVDLKFNGSDSTTVSANTVGTLSWTTTNAPTSCSASINWNGSKNPAGGSEGNINVGTSNKTYTITCSNTAGSATDTVNVTVTSAPTCDVTASGLQGPTTVAPNSAVNVAWTLGGGTATSCTASGSWSGSKSSSGGNEDVNVGTSNKTYTISCSNAAGSCTDSVTVNVGAAPTVDIRANGSNGPITVAANSSVPLTWTTTGSPTSCSASGSWTGSKGSAASNGPENQNVGTGQKTYTITCTKSGGYPSATDTVVVNVSDPPVCGTRHTTYPSTTTNWPSGSSYCSVGTNSSSPSFPTAGSSVSWNCLNGGATASCTATRTATVVNGSCSTTTNNSCLAGTLQDTTDTSTNYLWNCNGQNGGTNASCSLSKAVNGECGSTNNACTTGTLSDTADSTNNYLWSCNGQNGGTNASCSLSKPGTVAPDLTAGGISPTTATPGVAVTLSSNISNIGNASTGASFTGLFQRATNSSGSDATDIGTDYNAALPAGWSNATTLSYTFSSAGTYYVRACADKSSGSNNGVITESNENNNCGPWTAITVGSEPEPPPPPTGNLSCYASPTNNVTGSQTTWTATVLGGGGPYTYSWSGTDGLSGSGSSINKTYNTAGTKSATVTLTSGGTESASCSTEIAVYSPPPDLTAGPTSPSTATVGTPVTISANVANNSDNPTADGFNSLFQRANSISGSGATDIGPVATPWLDAWSAVSVTRSYTFTSAGTFYLRVCADKTSASDQWGSISESNEYNNCGPWRLITVSAGSPATACSVNPSSLPESGGTVTYSANPSGSASSPYTWTPSDGQGSYGTAATAQRTFTSAHAGNSYGMSVTASPSGTSNCPAVSVGSVCVGSPTGTVTASPARVREGDSATITVSNLQNARTSCTLTGPGVNQTYTASSCVATGGTVATPAMYTQGTYILSCDGAEVDRIIVNILPNFKEF